MSPSEPLPIEIDVHETARLLGESNEDFVLLDVREQDEYEFCSIEGSTLIPMSQLQERIAEVDSMANKHIVVHCHHGGRSLHVTEALRARGLERVQNMAGGIDLWSMEIDAKVPRY